MSALGTSKEEMYEKIDQMTTSYKEFVDPIKSENGELIVIGFGDGFYTNEIAQYSYEYVYYVASELNAGGIPR